MSALRPAAVAGMFYPEAPDVLASTVHEFLAAPGADPADAPAPKAIIVPHAGFIYSGAIAGAAFARLSGAAGIIRRVLIFGPAHRAWVKGLALPSADAFATPLGSVEVDAKAVAQALTLPQVVTDDAAHALEHSLEVQLPFLRTVLPSAGIVPFAVGAASPQQVAGVMELLWGGPETLIVVSSDLSHYLDYAEATRADRDTVAAVMALWANLGPEQACGAPAINGLLLCARRHGLAPTLLDLRNSGDTAGDRSRVVGYASIAFGGALHGNA